MVNSVNTSPYEAYGVSAPNTSADRTAVENRIRELEKSISDLQEDESGDTNSKSQQIAVYRAEISNLQAQLARQERPAASNPRVEKAKTDTIEISDYARKLAGIPEREQNTAGTAPENGANLSRAGIIK